ncbi:fructose-bisphosphate aldolase [Cadophora sp. MPI-SDFR-AT-0126]|nr:fructose-bisphosphate aldolase [Leotiomycetes sp. MPI-SDFR-AT-0126]
MSPSKVIGFPENNLTHRIIHDAVKGGYAVGGYCVYNAEGVLAVVKAAERCRSPAMIQLFPWSIHFQGPAFIKFVAETAHAASVPISVHLDHCLKPEDAEIALECAFDSIMVDGSLFEEEESIAYVKSVVDKAKLKGITIEAELGRMEGSEDGLPTIDLETVWTDPNRAREFVDRTGVHFLAPSFGNVHGPYPVGGAEKHWQIDRLEKIHAALGDETPLVLHGTHPLSDNMVRASMARGMAKINQNRTVREEYMKHIAENSGKLELTALQSQGVELYSKGVERMMVEVFNSAGKA